MSHLYTVPRWRPLPVLGLTRREAEEWAEERAFIDKMIMLAWGEIALGSRDLAERNRDTIANQLRPQSAIGIALLSRLTAVDAQSSTAGVA